MFSNIFLNRTNLLHNVSVLEDIAGGPILVMVKANGYGHGAKEIVKMLDGRIKYFGVSNQSEAEQLRQISDSNIVVFGACEDYEVCIKKKISFALFSSNHLKQIIKLYKKLNIKPQMHLCINTGMNRYGVKDIEEYTKIINLLKKNKLSLEGIYTHFSSLTSDKDYTAYQHEKFMQFVQLLPDENTLIHIGGGLSIFTDFKADLHRVGLEVYGYGNEFVKPVLSIESQIVDIQQVKKGEHVGYLCSYTAEQDMTVATIPLGYADGLPRKLSNKLIVSIKGKKAKNIGNICMDAFMVDISHINCKIGDRVVIMKNASDFAPLIESTEYEVLTNLSKFRGERKIILKNQKKI